MIGEYPISGRIGREIYHVINSHDRNVQVVAGEVTDVIDATHEAAEKSQAALHVVDAVGAEAPVLDVQPVAFELVYQKVIRRGKAPCHDRWSG